MRFRQSILLARMLVLASALISLTCSASKPPQPVRDYFIDLHVEPAGELLLSLVTGVYRSIDGGASWIRVLDPGSAGEQLRFVSAGPFGVIASGNTGIYSSTDHGTSWIRSGSPHVVDVVDRRGTLFGCQSNRVEYSRNQGKDWQATGSQPDLGCSYLRTSGKTVYAVAPELLSMERSGDSGKHWEPLQSPGDELGSGEQLNLLRVQENGTLYANTKGGAVINGVMPRRLYRSTDEGRHWRRMGFGYGNPDTVMGEIIGTDKGTFHMLCFQAARGTALVDIRYCSSEGGENVNMAALAEPLAGEITAPILSRWIIAANGKRYANTAYEMFGSDASGQHWRALGRKGLPSPLPQWQHLGR